MTAINSVAENNGDFIGAFRENVIRVISEYSTSEEILSEIDGLLDKDTVEERKQSVLTRMTIDMSRWAKELDLEH